MAITVEAIFENGVLKLAQPLPPSVHGKVMVTVHTASEPDLVDQYYGLIRWTGDIETLRRIAEDPEFDILESP